MNAEVEIKELENPNEITYGTNFECEVKITNLSTSKAVAVLEGILPTLEVTEVIHYRKRKKIFYRTIIKAWDFSIDVHSGLGSGYGGEGPNGFSRVLQKIGLTEEQAQVVFDSKYEDAVISIRLTNDE